MVVGRVAPGTQARQLAFTQLFFTALFAATGLAIAEVSGLPLKQTTFNATVMGAILWLAVIVAFVQVLLSWAQRYGSCRQGRCHLRMESVFAAITAVRRRKSQHGRNPRGRSDRRRHSLRRAKAPAQKGRQGVRIMTDARPVGILDSGFGGLSVARAVAELLPHESLIYTADCGFAPWATARTTSSSNARMPSSHTFSEKMSRRSSSPATRPPPFVQSSSGQSSPCQSSASNPPCCLGPAQLAPA